MGKDTNIKQIELQERNCSASANTTILNNVITTKAQFWDCFQSIL